MSEMRSDWIYTAHLADETERFDGKNGFIILDMVDSMRKVASETGVMSVEERNWFSMAYKNSIGKRRSALRTIKDIEEKEESRGNIQHVSLVQAFRQKLEEEMTSICKDVISILTNHLIPKAEDPEAKVFYNKMAGDYHRYEAEFARGDSKKAAVDASLAAYQAATLISNSELPPTNAIRLGLALNFSVFYFEILGQPDEAINLAKSAFDEAIAKLDSVSESSYKDSTIIMQLLRDNLTLWKSERDEAVAAENSSVQHGNNAHNPGTAQEAPSAPQQ